MSDVKNWVETAEIARDALRPYFVALPKCIDLLNECIRSGEPGRTSHAACACRFEEPCSSFWARMGQQQGWCTVRDARALVFVGAK